MKRRGINRNGFRAFTIIEVMLAILIFSMILAAIYSMWISIFKGTLVGQKAAMAVQRSRIAMNTLENAFLTSVMFAAHQQKPYYAFTADTSGDMAYVSLVSRLPEGFPGVDRYGAAVVRRVEFTVEPGPDGVELVMNQAPMLQDLEKTEAYKLVLAKDVTKFTLEFFDNQKQEWLDEWSLTNQMPATIRIILGTGKSGRSSEPQDIVSRDVHIPSVTVMGDIQGSVFPGGGGVQPVVPPGVGVRPRVNR